MYNIKKIISLVVCLALFMQIPVFAADTQSEAGDILSSEYRGLFTALDIELMPQGSSVSRGQFVTTLVDLMGFTTYGSGKQTFADVSFQNAELHSAVEYAVGIGAVSAGENFYPDRSITFSEALKMTVEVLGYGRDAQYRGGYPTGYYAVASSLDIYEGIDIGGNFTADTMYMLLGNAATTEIKTITECKTDGEFVACTMETTVPFLEAYRDIVHAEGVVTASDSGYLYDSATVYDNGKVMVGDAEFAVDDGVVCPLGYHVDAYAQKIGNRYVIIFADISENNVIEIAADSVFEVADTAVRYYDDADREKKVAISSDTAVLYNGKAFEDYSPSDILINDGYIEAIDNDISGSIDVLCIWEAKYLIVDYVNVYSADYDYVFLDKNRKNNIFITSDTNFRSNVNIDSIAKDAVLEAYVSKDLSFVKINVLSEIVSGSVSEVGAGGDIYVGGKCYKASEYFKEFYSAFAAPGRNLSFAVDAFGSAIAVTTAGGGSMKYAYFDDMSDKQRGLDDSVTLKLFTEDGEVITPKLADKVSVNSESKRAREWVGTLNSVKGELIKYQLNDSGEISKINTQKTEGIYDAAVDGADALKRFRFSGDDSDATVYYKIFGYIVPHFTLSSQTKIFKISTSETNDEDRFSLGTLSFIGNDAKVPGNSIRPYNVSITGVAGALLYTTSEAAMINLSASSPTAVVAECTLALDDAGDEAYKIKLYSGGRFTDYYIRKDAKFLTALTFNDKGYPFDVGDVIRYAADDKNEYLLTAVIDFDGAAQTLLYNAGYNTELHYYFGQIYAEGDGSVAIKQPDGSIVYVPMAIGDSGVVEDGKVMTQPREMITTYLQMGEACHKILLRCRYCSVGDLYIFK